MWNDTLEEFASSFKKMMVLAPKMKYTLAVKIDTIDLKDDELKEFAEEIENRLDTITGGETVVNTPRPRKINKEGEKSLKSSMTSIRTVLCYEDVEPGDHAMYTDFSEWLHAKCNSLKLPIKGLALNLAIARGNVKDEEEDE